MIVAFQPRGTIKSVRVVLRFGEKLPNKYNTIETEIHEEGEDQPLPWTLIKPVGQVLPDDSPYLTVPLPDLEPINILDLTKPAEPATFEHVDIIRMDESEEK